MSKLALIKKKHTWYTFPKLSIYELVLPYLGVVLPGHQSFESPNMQGKGAGGKFSAAISLYPFLVSLLYNDPELHLSLDG